MPATDNGSDGFTIGLSNNVCHYIDSLFFVDFSQGQYFDLAFWDTSGIGALLILGSKVVATVTI
jgi:hypothetical protein